MLIKNNHIAVNGSAAKAFSAARAFAGHLTPRGAQSRPRAIADTGVDFISTSHITMGARPFDLGLDVQIA